MQNPSSLQGATVFYAEPLPPSLKADTTKCSSHLMGEMHANAQPALRRAYLRPQPPLEKLPNRLPNLPRMGLQCEMLVADHRNPPLEMSERAFASLANIR